jgi:AcrR family transcriptional regulator
MPKRVDAAEQRAEICRAARRVFGQRGVAGTGLTHVAEVAGMGRSSLYHYYPDKQSLLRDLVKQALVEEREVFEGVLRGEGAPRERVERLARVLVSLFDEYAGAVRMMSDLRLLDAAPFRRFFRKVRTELAAVIAEGQARGDFDPDLDPALSAATLIGAIDGLLFQHFADGRAFATLDGLADTVARFTRKALSP